METLLFAGVFDLSWWRIAAVGLGLTHLTIVSVTVFLHRHQAHHALALHPAMSHFFRFWLWLTTGMVTREWVAVHRKHHAKCETPEDPHSPQVLGINRLLAGLGLATVKRVAPQEVQRAGKLKRWLDQQDIRVSAGRQQLTDTLPASRALLMMMVTMRGELAAIWARSTATSEQLVAQLQGWCERAEASGIVPLAEFSQRLRRYA